MKIYSSTVNRLLSYTAKLLSYICHPLFIPTYFFLWVEYRFPEQSAGASLDTIQLRLIGVFITTAFFPALTVFLLWRLKFIQNIYLRTNKERIVPYLASMIFYWWMWYLARGFNDQATVLRYFYLGMFIATIPAVVLNTFSKVSMHAMGVGGFCTALLFTNIFYQTHLGFDTTLALLIAGTVLSARIFLKEHLSSEIYIGLFIGICSQVLSFWLAW